MTNANTQVNTVKYLYTHFLDATWKKITENKQHDQNTQAKITHF